MLSGIIERAKNARSRACSRVKEEAAALARAKEDFAAAGQAQGLLQAAAQAVQQRAHEQIAGVVTKCIQSVFGPAYEFRIDFEQKRGKTEARLVFVKDGKEEDPLDGSGGGVLDVAALALRLTCIVLRKPKGRKLLVLDEPFRNVNGELYRERAAALLEALADEFGVQIIMSTGYEWLHVGKVVRVG